MENNEETKYHKPYRIMEGDIISIIRQDRIWNDKKLTFYKTPTKNKKDDTQTYYKQLRFPTGTDLKDGTRIKINEMTEYAWHKDKFTDAYYLFISDFDELGEKTSEAINEYKEEVYEKQEEFNNEDNNDMLW